MDMAAQTQTEGKFLATLEGQIAHLATKADIGALDAKIESLRADLDSNIESLRAEMSTMKWMLSIAIPAAIAITGIVVGIVVQILNNPAVRWTSKLSGGRADFVPLQYQTKD